MRVSRSLALVDWLLIGLVSLLALAVIVVLLVDYGPWRKPQAVDVLAPQMATTEALANQIPTIIAAATAIVPPTTLPPATESVQVAATAADATAPSATPDLLPVATATITPVPVVAGVPAADTQPQAVQAVSVPAEVALAAPAPILMYHYVRSVDQTLDPMGYDLSVDPATFAAQMEWLQANGYTGISMAQMMSCLRGETLCPSQPIVLTFDDGYQDAYDQALPVLQQYNFSATFYIISAAVGYPGYMDWDGLRALVSAGMEIGSHTVDHYDLTTLDWNEANRQIVQSKSDLEQQLGISVTSFCYPSGKYSWENVEQVRAAGYQSATTTRWDEDYSDPFTYPRRRISGGMTIDSFVAVVRGY